MTEPPEALAGHDRRSRLLGNRGFLISTIITLMMHERRHGDGFGHVQCCTAQGTNVTAACDQTYDESNISPYGLQYWSP